MKIALASDHAGYELKEDLRGFLKKEGHEPEDLGAFNAERSDYPDWAEKVAQVVSDGRVGRGVLICSTGVGMAVVANKFPNVRAALVTDLFIAKKAKEHNDANILVLASAVTGKGLARLMVKEWLEAKFAGGRYQRRLEKIAVLERTLLKTHN